MILIFIFYTILMCDAQSAPQDSSLPEAMNIWASHRATKDEFSGKREMSGIRLENYKDFTKWPLVTVRYRRDSTEQRFTYANTKAMATLQKNSVDYPDGSVFIKVGHLTEDDPVFHSSAVPSGPTRIQVMLRNKKKYASTNGWGYAIFNANGETMPNNPEYVARACAACHNIVADRGYVFSQPMKFNLYSSVYETSKLNTSGTKKINFSTRTVASLPNTSQLYKYLAGEKDFQSLDGEISKFVFFGTFNEVWPVLLDESIRSKRTAVLTSPDQKGFSLARLNRSDTKINCPAQQKAYETIAVRFFTPSGEGESPFRKYIDSSIVCR